MGEEMNGIERFSNFTDIFVYSYSNTMSERVSVRRMSDCLPSFPQHPIWIPSYGPPWSSMLLSRKLGTSPSKHSAP